MLFNKLSARIVKKGISCHPPETPQHWEVAKTNTKHVFRKLDYNRIITIRNSSSICFQRHLWFVPDSSKLDSAHLWYLPGFVVQFPKNTGSSKVFCNLKLKGPPKSQVFSAFEPVEQIRKLCSPAKDRPKPEFCTQQILKVSTFVPFPLFFDIETNLLRG